jgi:predicted  nucleic acid-binding Zn-ribbon protein
LSDSDLQIQKRICKVEALLVEKNIELEKLQNLLEAERKYKVDFEKIKNLLEWQVFQSRQMNKEIKSQLEVLSIQGKEFQDEASRLKTELNYKQQVLAQNESKILELKNRLHGFLATDASNPQQKTKINPEEISFDEFDWRTKLEE